jgi:hypothetical protein
MSGDNYEE